MKDGLRTKCIECRRVEHIEYRQSNPEKIKQLQRLSDKRKRQNPEYIQKKKLKARIRDATEVGKLKNRLRQERYYKAKGYTRKQVLSLKQKLKQKIRAKNWRSINKDKSNAFCALRRANKKNATPPWLTLQDKEKILELYTICRMFKLYTGQDYHVDHIVPLLNKDVCGLHIPCNLRIITAFENLSKNNKFDETLGIDYSSIAYQKNYATS